MNKISCSVSNCSHNSNGTCYSNRVNIGGKSAKSSCNTCCGSFLDKANYSNLTSNTNSNGPCDTLVCNVSGCAYNDNTMCSAQDIVVGSGSVNLYTETSCETFRAK